MCVYVETFANPLDLGVIVHVCVRGSVRGLLRFRRG